VGAHFGRYKVAEELGRGAMGVVYRAQDPTIGRQVAIKVINERYLASVGVEAEEYFERFRREAEVAGSLSHRGIVKIYDLGPNYIVMELVEGQTLATLMHGRAKQHLSTVLEIVSQVAAALDHAHGKGIVHRDVKPANVMIEADGTVKVMDFGLARIDSSTLTAAGEILGSASYMAPELIVGRPASPQSDLFSLGVVAYELLTADRPFGGASVSAIIHSIVEKTPRPVHTLNLSLPPAYDEIFAKVLAKDPRSRYPSASAFADALVLKKWADRDPTITGPLPEVSPHALTVMDGEEIRAIARAAAAAAASQERQSAADATVIMAGESSSSIPETIVLSPPAKGGQPAAGEGPVPAPPVAPGLPPPATSAKRTLVVGMAVGCGVMLLAAVALAAVIWWLTVCC
jgi:serine/threonine-protein kinase